MNKTLLQFTLALLLFCPFIPIKAQKCEDGMSGEYPCDMVNQIAYRSLDFFDVEDANDLWGWTSSVTGREYVLLGLHDRTAFLDISTPTKPLYLGYLPTATVGSVWRDIKVIDHYAYIVSEAQDHGMQVFDLNHLENLAAAETPKSFTSDAWYDLGHSHNIVADTANKFVYAVGTSSFQGGLYAIDVSDPLNPTYAGSNSIGGYVHDAQALTYDGPDSDYTGQQIVVGFNETQMVVYDATVKSDIEVISQSTYENVGYTHQGWFTDDRHYLISNDETDELDFGINTRSIIWDMTDLDNPQLVSYVDLGTPSIDHNLYIKGDMVYESNYTSGLRILDLLEIGEGELNPFGYYDVYPSNDNPMFEGSWSNYPFFKSGVIPVSGITTGLHLVKPLFTALDRSIVKVCDEETTTLDISVNRRYFGPVTFTVNMENVPGLDPQLAMGETDGAPAQNTVSWSGLGALAPGTYPGEVVISNNSGETHLPFVLIKGGGEVPPQEPQLVSPLDEVLPDQLVDFTFSEVAPGYALLQVALDSDFQNIVYQHEYFDSGLTLSAQMPYDQTAYFWRVIVPDGCGDDLFSDVGTFTIDIATNVAATSTTPAFAIYPNPANDRIYLAGLPADVRTVRVFDIAGRQVFQKQIAQNRAGLSLDVSGLSAGVYMVQTDKTARAVKFVKN